MRVFYALHSNRFKDFYMFLKSYELLIFIRKTTRAPIVPC